MILRRVVGSAHSLRLLGPTATGAVDGDEVAIASLDTEPAATVGAPFAADRGLNGMRTIPRCEYDVLS